MSSFLQDKLQPEEGVGEGPTGYRIGRDMGGNQSAATPSLWILALEPSAEQMKGLSHPNPHILSFRSPQDPTACSLYLHPNKETERRPKASLNVLQSSLEYEIFEMQFTGLLSQKPAWLQRREQPLL